MRILSTALILAFLLSSCVIVKKFAGADIDPVQFAKAREAKMLEKKSNAESRLKKTLENSNDIDNSDMMVILSQNFIQNLVKQYIGVNGWLDSETSYTVQDVKLQLDYAAAFASLDLKAFNKKWDVDVHLTMDCILTFDNKNNELYAMLEPFNITPDVTVKGFLSSADEIIRDLIKINLGSIGEKFPAFNIPVDINNKAALQASNFDIRDKINMNISSPERNIKYSFKLKDVLVLKDKILVPLTADKVEVK